MKILVLFDLAFAPEPDQQYSARALRREHGKPTEADVLLSLRRQEHEVDTLGVFDNVHDIIQKIDAFKPETISMFTYSPVKNIANFMEEYSVWNPAISSDSASGRSNGARFVSATIAIR